MSDTTTLIATLENAPGIIIPLIREVPPQYLKRRPSPTKWSAHEHGCHLSKSDGPFLARLDRAAPIAVAHMQDVVLEILEHLVRRLGAVEIFLVIVQQQVAPAIYPPAARRC